MFDVTSFRIDADNKQSQQAGLRIHRHAVTKKIQAEWMTSIWHEEKNELILTEKMKKHTFNANNDTLAFSLDIPLSDDGNYILTVKILKWVVTEY